MRKDLDLKKLGIKIENGVEVDGDDIYQLDAIKNVVEEIINNREKIEIEEFNNSVYNSLDMMTDDELSDYYSRIRESKKKCFEKSQMVIDMNYLAVIINSFDVDDFKKLINGTSEEFVLNMLRFKNCEELPHLLYDLREDFVQSILKLKKIN